MAIKMKEQAREDVLQALKEIQEAGGRPGRTALTGEKINVRLIQKTIREGLPKFKQDHGISVSRPERARRNNGGQIGFGPGPQKTANPADLRAPVDKDGRPVSQFHRAASLFG